MSIKILHWNIWYKEDPEKVVKKIKEIDPDIVCLQELIRDSRQNIDVSKYIGDKLDYNHFYKDATTWDFRDEKEGQGNAVYSRFPIEKTFFSYVQDFQHNPPNAASEGRVYVEAIIDIEGRKLIVGTTHLSYSYAMQLNEARIKEADRLIEATKRHDSNYIFTGDLNTIPDDYIIKGLSRHLKNLGPDYNEKTWTTKPFKYKDGFEENNLNWRLDYVMGTQDLEVINSEIVHCDYSDHLPILVEIK